MERTHLMKKRKRNKRGRITAWLVTWEWIGDHAKRDNKIVAVLNWRLSPEKISEMIEMIYANEYYSLEERVAFAKNKKMNPYKTTYDDINGIPWKGRLFCGHNPFLVARLVDNLYVKKDSSGNEVLDWEKRKKPDLSWIHSENS